MPDSPDFVVFSDDWGRWPSSSQHLFRRLAEQHRVLWVETVGMRRPRPSWRDLRRSVEKVRSWTGADVERPWCDPPGNLVRFAPPMHPWFGTRLGNRSNDALLIRAVRKKMSELGIHQPILVITVPIAAGVIGHLGEVGAVYYRVDDFTLWPGYAAQAIRQLEHGRLLPRAKALVYSADALDVPSFQGPRLRLDHGVDTAHFGSASARPPELPASPFALFAGRVDERLDRSLLEAVPIPVVVVGNDRGVALPEGVTLHPPVPYAELPGWLHAADVLLLPYVRSALTETIQPLKLREYLATGRPIAASRLPEVERICGDLVEFGDEAESYGEAVTRALGEGRSRDAQRRALIAEDDWAQRARAFGEFVSQSLV